MSDSWVKWSTWTEAGCTNFGEMCLKDVGKHLREFGAEAKKLLDKTGADHILYGVKLYNNDGELEKVKFYLLPMSDEEFEKVVANKRKTLVYAYHKMR